MTFFGWLAISTLLCILMAVLPGLTFFMAVFWGACLILAALYIDRSKLIFIYLVNLTVLLVLVGISTLFFYLSFFGLATMLMSLLVSKGWDYYGVQKWGIITATMGVSLFLLIVYFSTGDIGINLAKTQIQAYIAESMDFYEESGMLELYEKRGMLKSDVEDTMYSMATTIAQHLPAIYYLQAILAVFFMLLLASRTSLKRGFERLKKKPYSQEIMPWQVVYIAIVGLLCWLIGRSEMSSIYYAGSNILVVLMPITVYYGLSAFAYRLKRYKAGSNKGFILFIVIIAIIFSLSAIIFLSLLGLFDALLDYRKLRREEKEDII